jgi:glutathione S-transferase
MNTAKPELISFKLCPYVQRSVIMLTEKGVEFDTAYVDLSNKPAWFLELSPLGKVPVLRVGDAVLFESAVINEYLDETHSPALHPGDPLRRAHNRAWIEFGGELLKCRYGLMTAKDREGFDTYKAQVDKALSRLEGQLGQGPYFNGAEFSLVDAAYAPLLIRLAVMEDACGLGLFDAVPRVRAWHEALMAYPAVKASLFSGFMEDMAAYIKGRNGYIARYISG